MRKIEDRVRTYTEKFTVETVCDLCAKTIEKPKPFNVSLVTVEYEHGCHFPEGGSSAFEHFDVCTSCWRTRVIPWFASQGANVGTHKTDF